MDKQKFLGLLAAIMIAAVAAFNVSLNSQEDVLSDISLENIEALADESGGDSYSCSSGGRGSSSCAVSANIGGVETQCKVDCNSGYYACCNAYQNKCQCRKN